MYSAFFGTRVAIFAPIGRFDSIQIQETAQQLQSQVFYQVLPQKHCLKNVDVGDIEKSFHISVGRTMKTIAAIFLSTVFASGFLGCARTEVAANSNQYDVEAAGSYPSLGEIVTSSGDRICSATYFGH